MTVVSTKCKNENNIPKTAESFSYCDRPGTRVKGDRVVDKDEDVEAEDRDDDDDDEDDDEKELVEIGARPSPPPTPPEPEFVPPPPCPASSPPSNPSLLSSSPWANMFFLHVGHDAFTRSHSSTHDLWKMCLHSSSRASSPKFRSLRQIGHVFSSPTGLRCS